MKRTFFLLFLLSLFVPLLSAFADTSPGASQPAVKII
jgi:hypothetical protein